MKIGAEAAKLPPAPARYIQNMKFGIRGSTFSFLQVSKHNPDTMYATTYNGFIYSTHDGGLSWQEGRLITQRVKFFGAIRPMKTANDAGFLMGDALSEMKAFRKVNCATQVRASVGDYLDFADGTVEYGTNGCFGAQTPEFARTDSSTYKIGGDSSRFGVGIGGGAPRLQALLKQKSLRIVGLNLKLLLNLKGVEPTWVNHVAIHPKNPKVALVATAMGVFRTTDGGLGWDHIFAGRSNAERFCNYIAYDQRNPDKVWLGTGQGLLRSFDGGDKFSRVTGTQLSSVRVQWLQSYEKNPDIMYAGSTIGVFKSIDGGQNWTWIFFETLPTQNFILTIAIDPNDPDRVQIGTKDGAFRTADGGKNWERSGAFMFTSSWVTRMAADPNDSKHVIATTYLNVWETFDWGDTWQAMYINDSDWSPRSLNFDPREKGAFMIVTSSEILRLTGKPPAQPDPVRLVTLQEQLAKEPPLHQVHDAAFRAATVHRGELTDFRRAARLSALLPRVHLFGAYVDIDITGEVASSSLGFDVRPGGGLAGGFDSDAVFLLNNSSAPVWYVGGLLSWDFGESVFHLEEAPFGRYMGQNNAIYLNLKYEVRRLFEERRRVLIQMVTIPPDNLRGNLALRLRLEELTNHLNMLTDGLYEPQVRWLESLPLVQ